MSEQTDEQIVDGPSVDDFVPDPDEADEDFTPNLIKTSYLDEFTEGVKMSRCELGFLINVENISNLGEALDKAAINLLRYGMDNFTIVATDLDTNVEFIVAQGEVRLADQDRLEELAAQYVAAVKEQGDDESDT